MNFHNKLEVAGFCRHFTKRCRKICEKSACWESLVTPSSILRTHTKKLDVVAHNLSTPRIGPKKEIEEASRNWFLEAEEQVKWEYTARQKQQERCLNKMEGENWPPKLFSDLQTQACKHTVVRQDLYVRKIWDWRCVYNLRTKEVKAGELEFQDHSPCKMSSRVAWAIWHPALR